ncbi:MAG: SusC/RagA family TonB-linked outer membrane protein [Dysgonamonadaceae bacterium]|nr:SusC/RagA family TonB-linked outer membrane protein [Dysgonamonadaceae bacterium]
MNKLKNILIALFFGCTVFLNGQSHTASIFPEQKLTDTLNIGYQIKITPQTSSYSIEGVNESALDKSPYIDISKALYGKIAGLNVYHGSGSSVDNISRLTIHGKNPLVLIDGFPRSISDITSTEIESIYVLKDAAASALYGMRGANGVVLISTKRGANDRLKVKMDYNFGVNTQFRSPEFADSYTYAQSLNTALQGDRLALRYNQQELDAFQTNIYPFAYPNVNWWDQTMNNTGYSHNLKMSFNGGNERFRYFTVIDYFRDRSMLKKNTQDLRFDTEPTDTRASLRTNIDVDITDKTFLKTGIVGKLNEINGTRYGRNNIFTPIYNTPSAAFPIRHENGIYGGNSVYGANNPVALLKDYGHTRNMYGTLLADMSLRQELDVITQGLGAEVLYSFDNIGGIRENSIKEYRYLDANARLAEDGTLVTTPKIYGKDSETLGHSQPFESLMVSSDFQAKMDYNRTFDKHNIAGALIYQMQSVTQQGRNNSRKNQSFIANATYIYDQRYILNGVFSRSGSSYLPDGDKYANYPAISAAWLISNESFMKNNTSVDMLKLRSSYGFSGWDGNLSHELWRQAYGGSGTSYNFGVNASEVWGGSEGDLPVVGLVAEKSEKFTLGVDLKAFNTRLDASVEGFYEKRSDMLVSGSNSTSGIIGIGIGRTNEGVHKFRGFDVSLSWNDKIGDFGYVLSSNMSYINSEVINENQAYQEYDYLYTLGNRVGQRYGLEAIGFFYSQQEINNSPQQTFSQVSPGDVKYKDQNGDNIIDEKDVVRMFGSNIPRFYFGFNINLEYKRFELNADFQGLTGMTISLLDSPLYKPLVGNGNISETFLSNETYWTPSNKENVTMPRLTTMENLNNYRPSSLWYRDGSFLKLRNLLLSYTFPKSQVGFADMKLFVQGTNLFSLDNIHFADPEQLGIAYPATRSYWAGIKFNF